MITDVQKQTLEDLSAEGLLKGLPLQTAEKDIHVTELLRGLSLAQVHHDHFSSIDSRQGDARRHDPGIRLVFSGGTCLSKAYALIDRMSEDIDIKVVLDPTPTPLKKGRGDRARLNALHDLIAELLEELGFPILEYPEGSNPAIRDSHRYYVVGAGYKTRYDEFASLRPELKLELIQRTPLLPLERREFGYLHEHIAGIPLSCPLTIECVSMAETAVEKVLSLLRRCAYKWDGHQTNGDIDPAWCDMSTTSHASTSTLPTRFQRQGTSFPGWWRTINVSSPNRIPTLTRTPLACCGGRWRQPDRTVNFRSSTGSI